jgi:hypothetical protein
MLSATLTARKFCYCRACNRRRENQFYRIMLLGFEPMEIELLASDTVRQWFAKCDRGEKVGSLSLRLLENSMDEVRREL